MMNNTKVNTAEELYNELAMNIGSEQSFFVRNIFGDKVYYTEGFKDFLEKAKCYWLLTDFLSLKILQVWKAKNKYAGSTNVFRIKRRKNSSCHLLFMNGDLETLWKKEIPYSDFPEGEFEFYIGNWNGEAGKMLCYLKSER